MEDTKENRQWREGLRTGDKVVLHGYLNQPTAETLTRTTPTQLIIQSSKRSGSIVFRYSRTTLRRIGGKGRMEYLSRPPVVTS